MMRTKTASKRRLMRYACAGGRDKEIRYGAERSLQRRLEASKQGEIEMRTGWRGAYKED